MRRISLANARIEAQGIYSSFEHIVAKEVLAIAARKVCQKEIQ